MTAPDSITPTPTGDTTCRFGEWNDDAADMRWCGQPATQLLDAPDPYTDTPLCDQHAERYTDGSSGELRPLT